jgi:multicomponent Na+:H+ antiporter subunit C
MEGLIAIVVGVLFACGIFLMLQKSFLRLILGLCLMSHGANLLLFTMGGLVRGAIPVGTGGGVANCTDPLVQALILTAIVISFGVTALLLVVAYRTHQEHNTDDLDELKELKG